MKGTNLLLALLLAAPAAMADQGGYTNAGGSASGGQGASISSTTSSPAGSLNLYCAPAATGCNGGSYNWVSADGTTAINAAFTSGTDTESCSGGGKGGNVHCNWAFLGNFSGVATINGQSEAINGTTTQYFTSTGTNLTGYSGWNSAYAPFYYSDSEQILRSDDLAGDNQISYGSQGSGVGQFYGAFGIALDSSGRIYVSDTYNCRVVRIDDMTGKNWTSFGGSCGAGQGQFADPSGIAIDSSNRIYVMDTGNSRLVRFDDMSGSNWTVFSNPGSLTGQVSSYVSVTVDGSGRIYIPDSGNNRIVRMDDMSGSNWVALSQSQNINGYIYSLQNPVGVAVAPNGQIFIADQESYQPNVIRVDDMNGSNWASFGFGQGALPFNGIAVDASGAAFLGGYGVRVVNDMYSMLPSSGDVGPIGTYYIFGITPVPTANPLPSAVAVTPSKLTFSENAGTNGDTQAVTLANIGGSPLEVSGIAAHGAFSQTNNCPPVLTGGASCTVSVSFAPTVTGLASGTLSLSDDSGNLGASQTVALSGLGTAPAVTLSATSLSFGSQVIGTASRAKTITLKSTGNGPLDIASIAASSPYVQTNTCGSEIAAGGSCKITVSFAPTVTGPVKGTLTLVDNAGTQTIALSGSGSAPVTTSVSSLNFGRIAVGTSSAAKTVTVTNHSPATVNFYGIAATAPFAIATSSCGGSLAAGARCNLGVVFSPAVSGAASGTLTLSDDALDSPQVVKLSGTGT